MESRFFVYHHNRTYSNMPHAAMKRKTLVCCCMEHILHNMAITRYLYVLVILMLWCWL